MPPDDLSRRAPETRGPAQTKRAYAKPQLIEYGSIAKLTHGTMTKQADTPAAGFKMVCL
jgi:hypothetical protein